MSRMDEPGGRFPGHERADDMSYTGGFTGFPRESLAFFEDLAMNNEPAWFKRHREEYELSVLEPSRRFVEDMGRELESIAPGVVADPRVNRSLFRINRDTRFSKDKTPYKTHNAVWLWEGTRPRMENSGFYLHFDPGTLLIGVGVYRFPKPLLEKYRESVADKKRGAALMKAIREIADKGRYSIGGKHYKRVPRGFDPDHENAELLLYNGLYAGEETAVPDELFSRDFISYCMERFRDMLPIHSWLRSMLEA